MIYRHVDLLNAAGIEAYVVHQREGFVPQWFEHATPIGYLDNRVITRARRKIHRVRKSHPPGVGVILEKRARLLGEDDIVVLPEISASLARTRFAGLPKVILNQGAYLTFRGYPTDDRPIENPYEDPQLLGVLTNSEDGRRFLEFAFPGLEIDRFHLAIDQDLFRPGTERQRQICYSPRKSEHLIAGVINTLKVRKSLDGWTLVPFQGISQTEVAEVFRESAIFLSFSEYEGFGLPAAEAMASGCLVVGFHGGGGREFMTDETCYPVAAGEVRAFVSTIEDVLQQWDSDPAEVERKRRNALDLIRTDYSCEREREDVLAFWESMTRKVQLRRAH